MMKRTHAYGVLLSALSLASLAYSAAPPRLEAVSVRARVLPQTGSEILRYEYQIFYGGAELRVVSFEVDVSSDATRAVLDSTGLSFAEPHFRASTELSLSELGSGRFVPVGSPAAPQFWASAVDPGARLRWGAIVDSAQIAPGSTVGPFVATSRGLPAIRDGAVDSNIVEFLPSVDESPGGLDDADAKMALGRQTLRTIGPAAPPAELDVLQFLTDIETMRAEARNLGWIRPGVVQMQVDSKIAQLRAQLEQGSINPARQRAAEIIASVEAAACTDFVCPPDRAFTAEARALLVENLRFLVSRLPEVTEPLSATAWLGLKNSDDQGTSFDLRAELYRNGVLAANGQALCITGITRNENQAKEVRFEVNTAGVTLASGDSISVKFSTRIGTNPDGTKCPGHSNAVGLRLYYDAASRPSTLGGDLSPSQTRRFFLHGSGATLLLDQSMPTQTTPQIRDSASIKFSGGNVWKEIGTWTQVQQ